MHADRFIPEGHQINLTFVDALSHEGFHAVYPQSVGIVVVHMSAHGNMYEHAEYDFGFDPVTRRLFDYLDINKDIWTPEWCDSETIARISDSLHT